MVRGDRIPNNELVIIKNPKYIKKLSTVLKSTDVRTVSNYLMWRAVKSKMSDLNQAAGKLKEKFNREVNGINSDPPRWKKCVKEVGFQSKEESSLRYIASSIKDYRVHYTGCTVTPRRLLNGHSGTCTCLMEIQLSG